jgi:hypothetical protein
MNSSWTIPGADRHNNEKRRLTLEDVERRFRRSGAVSDTYAQVSETCESDVVVLISPTSAV